MKKDNVCHTLPPSEWNWWEDQHRIPQTEEDRCERCGGLLHCLARFYGIPNFYVACPCRS